MSDQETFRIYQERIVRARKSHQCDGGCGGVILKGELYEQVLCWCETYATLRYCSRCGTLGGVAPHWSKHSWSAESCITEPALAGDTGPTTGARTP